MNANPASADLYERLGVSPDAGQEEIRAAFKAMRKELHPDSRPESLRDHFDGLMKNVNEANQILSNPTSRRRYDDKLARSRSGNRDGAANTAGEAEEPEPDAAWSEWEEDEVYYDEGPDEPKPGPDREDRREHAGTTTAATETVQPLGAWFTSPETIARRLPPAANLVGATCLSVEVWSFGILFFINIGLGLLALVYAIGVPVAGYFALKGSVLAGYNQGRNLGIVLVGAPVLALVAGFGATSFLVAIILPVAMVWAVIWGWALVSERQATKPQR